MKKFQIPKVVKDQLREFSRDGYCLFITNEDGNIDVIFDAKNETGALALITKINQVGQQATNEIMGFIDEDEPEG